MSTKKRKLAAILFADIVGYTSLMQKDEQTASTLLRHFQKQLEEKVKAYHGRIVNFYGDGALCTFPIPIDAVRCAMALQTTFGDNPKTPVRIGIHSGTVTLEGEKIFGDSVNLASRIESLGVASAILISKKVRDEVKNNPDLNLQSLGSFEFKNVEEPMEVYALANEGFAIPKREEMKGMLKVKKSSNRLLFSVLGILIVTLAGFWFLKKDNSLLLGDEFLNNSTPISEEYRQKRVAIMVFENKTGSENLEDFGTMISDWITKGLMETGKANVISAANIQNQIKQAGVATPEFAASTGVGVVLQGRYYLQEDQLIIHANIVDTEKGEVIYALDHIQGNRNEMLDLLDELTQKVLGYWAVKNQKRYLQNPPKYGAYQKFMAAKKIFANFDQFEKTERLLQEAYQLDTTFYAPLLKLAVLYENTRGKHFKRDSVVQFIEKLDPQFTQYEKLRLDYIKAQSKNQHLKAAQINEQIYQMDHSDGGANTNASFFYLRANMPQKALELINDMDPRFQDMSADFSWPEIRRTQAYFELGDYDKVITVAEAYAFPKLMSDIASLHLRALVQLDSIEAIEQAYQEYINKGFYAFNGMEREDRVLLERICSEAYLCNKNEILNEYVPRYIKWTEENKDSSHRHFKSNMGFAAFLQGNIKEALSIWEKQKIDPMRKWNYANKCSQVGVCHAMLGNIEKAEEQLAILEATTLNVDWPIDLYFKARIQAALGRFDKAVQNIEIVVEKGIFLMHSERGKADVFLKPMHGYPPFEELVKPKG